MKYADGMWSISTLRYEYHNKPIQATQIIELMDLLTISTSTISIQKKDHIFCWCLLGKELHCLNFMAECAILLNMGYGKPFGTAGKRAAGVLTEFSDAERETMTKTRL